MSIGLYVKYRLLSDVEKYSSIKFYENRTIRSRLLHVNRQTDRQTDMTQLFTMSVFLNNTNFNQHLLCTRAVHKETELSLIYCFTYNLIKMSRLKKEYGYISTQPLGLSGLL